MFIWNYIKYNAVRIVPCEIFRSEGKCQPGKSAFNILQTTAKTRSVTRQVIEGSEEYQEFAKKKKKKISNFVLITDFSFYKYAVALTCSVWHMHFLKTDLMNILINPLKKNMLKYTLPPSPPSTTLTANPTRSL